MMFKAGSHYGGTKGNCLDTAVRTQRDICSMVCASGIKAVVERHCCHLIGLQRRCVLGSLEQDGRQCFLLRTDGVRELTRCIPVLSRQRTEGRLWVQEGRGESIHGRLGKRALYLSLRKGHTCFSNHPQSPPAILAALFEWYKQMSTKGPYAKFKAATRWRYLNMAGPLWVGPGGRKLVTGVCPQKDYWLLGPSLLLCCHETSLCTTITSQALGLQGVETRG